MASTPTASYFLSWGLLHVPLKSLPAAREERISLKNVHDACVAAKASDPTTAQRFQCRACAKILENGEILSGWEHSKGSWVALQKDVINSLKSESNKIMTLIGFVEWREVDPIWLAESNFLGPIDRASSKAYALLRDALLETKRAALVSYPAFGRDHIGVIRPYDDKVLMLHEMYFSNEVRDYASQAKVQIEPTINSPEEKEVAKQLVDQLTVKFDPTPYRDGYRERLQTRIQALLEGTTLPDLPAPTAPPPMSSLLESLKQSLEATKKTKPQPEPERKPTAKVETQEKKVPRRKSA